MSRTSKNPQTPSLPELVDLYLLRCTAEGKSERTISAYSQTLRRFLRAISDGGAAPAADAVDEPHIYRFLAQMKHLSASSRHRYFRETRAFFNWAVTTHRLPSSPFREISNVRLPKKIVQPYNMENVRDLLTACSSSPVGVRDRAIMFLLLDTGVRLSELTQLNLDDVALGDRRIRVLHGKGNKQRVVPISETCHRELSRYVDLRGWQSGPLFVSSNGHGQLVPAVRLQPNGVKQLLRRLGRRTGLVKVHAHRFRHTFATWAISQGARELDVQLLLGHSTADMVRHYSATYNVEQAAVRHDAFSPVRLLPSG